MVLLVSLCLLLAAAAAWGELESGGCDCESLGLRHGEEPVCGDDGLIYATACLADCQGVGVVGRIAAGTVCGGEGFAIAHPAHFEDAAQKFDAPGVIRRFAAQGFRYLGIANKTRQDELHASFSKDGRVKPLDLDKDSQANNGRRRLSSIDAINAAAQVDIMYSADGHIFGRKSSVGTKLFDGEHKKQGDFPKQLRRNLHQDNSAEIDGGGVDIQSTDMSSSHYLSIFGDNGADDRAEVTDTNQDPFRKVGYIDPIGCTGSLIGPRHVLTAGHCTYSLDHGVWYPVTFRFSPAKTKNNNPYGTVEFENIMVKGCFTTAGLPECDFAVIYLKEDIGDQTGYFGLGLDCDSNSVDLHIAGYPSDKPDQSMWTESCGAASVSCSPDPKLIVHSCDVVEGTSGSPLWDNQQQVRAVHKGAYFSRDQRYGNIAVYITPYVHDNLNQWLDQSG